MKIWYEKHLVSLVWIILQDANKQHIGLFKELKHWAATMANESEATDAETSCEWGSAETAHRCESDKSGRPLPAASLPQRGDSMGYDSFYPWSSFVCCSC